LLKDAMVQEKIIERVHQAEYATPSVVREPEPEWRVGSFRAIDEDEGFQRVVDESAPTAGSRDEAIQSSAGEPSDAQQAEDASGTPFRHIGEVLPGWLRERLDAVGMNETSQGAGAEGEATANDGEADE